MFSDFFKAQTLLKDSSNIERILVYFKNITGLKCWHVKKKCDHCTERTQLFLFNNVVLLSG